MTFSRFNFSYLLWGLLMGFFRHFLTLGVNVLVITIWGEAVVTKSKTAIIVIGRL
jgi:hypothetical protein